MGALIRRLVGCVEGEHQARIERAEQHAVSAILCIQGGDLVLPGADERAAQWPGHALGVISIVNETGPWHEEIAIPRAVQERAIRH